LAAWSSASCMMVMSFVSRSTLGMGHAPM
jgi:hypothetical protein